MFADNIFAYESHPGRGSRTAIGISHRGYDPPRRRHLLTKEEEDVLRAGDAARRRALLLSHCGIDMGKVRVYGNTFRGVDTRFAFASSAQYGATSRGWDGSAEIIDLARTDPSP